MVFPIVAPPDPRGPLCELFCMYVKSESFHANVTYFDSMVLEKNSFK
jgi:hypothetical protein